MNYSYGNESLISPQKEKAIRLLLYDEQTVSALKTFTQEITKSGQQKNTTETADNIYWISECLFRLKKLTFLDTLLQTGILFTQKNNADAFSKLKIIEGKSLIEKGKYKECIRMLTELSTQIKDITLLCEIRLTMADANQRLQLLNQSKLHYDYVLKTATDAVQKARANNGLGSYYCILSDFDSAILFYNIAFKQFQQELGEQHSRIGQVHYNLGLIADRKFDLYEAELHFTKALQLYKKRLGDLHPRTAETYGSLGSLFFMKDNPGKALYYSVKERDILLKLYGKDNPDLAYSYLNCGKIYYLLGDKIQSEQQLLLALDLVKKYFGVNHNLYAQCMVELSDIYSNQKRYTDAERILQEILQIKKNNPDDYLADIYHRTGENFFEKGVYEKSFHQFNKARSLYVQYYGKKNVYLVNPLLGMSDILLRQKKPLDAYAITKSALELTKEKQQIVYPYDHWLCVMQLLKCKKFLNENNVQSNQSVINDIELIKTTLQKANNIKNTLYNTGSQLYYAERMAELNELGIYFLTHFYKKTDTYFLDNLLFFAENSKANLLRNRIINYKAEEILPLSEKAKSSAITGRLNYFISLNENQEATQFNINDSILFYQNLYETFSKSIEKKYPKIYRLKYGEVPLSARQIQKQLPKDYTLLEYCNDGTTYYCLAVSKNHITYKICGNKHRVDSLIATNQQLITNKHYNTGISHQLFKILLPQSLHENLLVSADGRIYDVPFDALSSNREQPDYVLYKHPIQYVFSAGTYFNHQPPVENKRIIGFYPDFINSPYAVLNNSEEHDALKLFSNYNVYHKKNALKENFIAQCNTSGIIHIASHLITDTLSPLKSFLVFQPDNSNYSLSINEIWKLKTNCQLITLASCQSNFGKHQNGEGIQNFAWAFHYAGARNILSTEWNASDKSTSAIISDFYRNLKNGKNKQEALQLAKINYLQHTDAIGAQPFFWSNFYLYGDETALTISPSFLVKFWWMPVFLLLLCYLAMVIIRKVYSKKQYDHL